MTLTGPARTLYITDLDGTLLPEGFLTDGSRELLARGLSEGLPLAVATNRSPATARRGLGDLVLEQPIVAYGGSTAVDADGAHLWWDRFDSRSLHPFIGASLAAGVTPLVFWLQDDADRISWVRGAETAGVDAFLEERPGDPRLLPVDGWDEVDHDAAFFLSVTGEYPVLRRLARMVRAISWGTGCTLALQRDPADPDVAVLDVTPGGVSKGSGARRIADERGFTRLVAFGDGTNDLPLFAEADESYAVASAPDEVKAAATRVLPDEPDAVARFLSQRVAQAV